LVLVVALPPASGGVFSQIMVQQKSGSEYEHIDKHGDLGWFEGYGTLWPYTRLPAMLSIVYSVEGPTN
jgi:hypothetical protein